MAVLMTPPFLQFFDANGDVLAGGKVNTYTATGTFSTRKATYTTEAGDVEHPNPVILDAAGRPATGNGSIWLSGTYDIVVTDANDVEVETTLNVTAFSALPSASDAYFETFSGTGSQTAFTTSEDLGVDEKAILVWVNEGLQESVTNGTFATDSGWTKGSGWSIGSGVATATGAISTAIEQTSAITLVEGQAYSVTYTITRSAGSLTPSVGGNDGTAQSASGTYTEVIIAGSSQTLAFTGSGFTGTLDNVSITQAVSSGYVIQSPTTYTISGTTLTFATAPASGTNNIYVSAPSLLVGAASSAAADAAASEAAAAASASAASTSASNASTSASAASTSAASAAVSEAGAATSAAAFTGFETSIFESPYNADSSGVTDASTAFQSAVDALDALGGGVVSFRGGIAKIANPVTLKRHVASQGVYDERAFNVAQATAEAGGDTGGRPNTLIHVTHGSGGGATAADAAFVCENNTGGLSNTLIAYPDQLTSGAAPTVYSPTIGVTSQSKMSFKNLHFHNSYTWFRFDGTTPASLGSGTCRIDNISGTGFGTCFDLDRVAENTVISNVRVWKFYANGGNDLDTYIRANSTVFKLGFTDGLILNNISSYDVKTTFHLVNNGASSGTGCPWVTINNISCDNNVEPIIIDDCNTANFIGGQLVLDVENRKSGKSAINITNSFQSNFGRATFTGLDVYNASHVATVSASKGQFSFSGISAKTKTDKAQAGRYDGDAVRGFMLIDEGNGGLIQASNLLRGLHRRLEHICGCGDTLITDGIRWPARGRRVQITGITQANPAVVSYTKGTGIDNPVNGETTFISGIEGMTELNYTYGTVANVDTGAGTFELSGVDSSAYTAYSDLGQVLLGTEMSMSGWDDRTNWSNNTLITNITDGIQFDLTSASYTDSTFSLPTELEDQKIAIIEFELEQSIIDSSGDPVDISTECKFNVEVARSGTSFVKLLDSEFVPNFQVKRKYIFPIFVPDSSSVLRISFGKQTEAGTDTATMNLTNLKVWYPTRDSITSAFIDAVYGTERFAKTSYGKFVDIENGKMRLLGTAAPTTGTWEQGDKIVNSDPDAGDPEGWICTVAGTSGGTWEAVRGIPMVGSRTYDVPDIAADAEETFTITVTGALTTDFVQVSYNASMQGLIVTGYVSAADTVTVNLYNPTGSNINLASGTWRAEVNKASDLA